jgi:hypothetical protein
MVKNISLFLTYKSRMLCNFFAELGYCMSMMASQISCMCISTHYGWRPAFLN